MELLVLEKKQDLETPIQITCGGYCGCFGGCFDFDAVM